MCPTRSRQLFDKDILLPGTWVVAGVPWVVSLAMLRRLVINFQRARMAGIRVPVVWNHSTDARDKIGEIVRLYMDGDTLRARFWASDPDDVRRLDGLADEVSVEVAEPWQDGRGKRYDLFLTHLAVVTMPVITPQQPMRRMSCSNSFEQVKTRCARRREVINSNDCFPSRLIPASLDGPVTTKPRTTQGNNKLFASSRETHPPNIHTLSLQGESPMSATATLAVDVDRTTEIAELVNQIVAALGTSHRLAQDVTGESLVDDLRQLRDEIDALVEIESNAERDFQAFERNDDASTATVASLQSRLDQVTRQLSIERRRSQLERAEAFEDAIDQLIGEGRIPAGDKPALLEAGFPANYALSLLAPFQRLPIQAAVPVAREAKRFTARTPNGSTKRPVTPERAKQIAGSFRS